MDAKTVPESKRLSRKSRWKLFKNDIGLYVMLAFPLLIALVFRYIPIGALIISFKNYNFVQGVFGSPWVGLKWFEKFLTSAKFGQIFWNTLKISLYSLIFSFPCPIILALSLNELRSEKFKRVVQTASYLPYFVSTVIVIGMMNQLLSPTTGIINMIITALGGEAVNFITEPRWFVSLYIISGIWSGVGYSSILYLSALTTISQPSHEMGRKAARMLLDAIEQPGCAQENVVMEPTLVERRSVRKVYRRLRR